MLLLGLTLWRFPVPMRGAPGVLRSAAVAGLLLVSALAVGRALLMRFKLYHGSLVEEAGFSLGAGLVVLSLLGAALGAAGVLFDWLLLILLGLLLLVNYEHLEALADLLVRSLRSKHPWEGSSSEIAALLVLALSSGVVLLLCLAPPTFYDAMVYHLAQAQRAALSGRIAPQPALLFSWLPALPQPLWAMALTLDKDPLSGVTAASLLNAAVFGLLGLMIMDASARLLNERRLWLAPALVLSQPLLALSFGVFSPDGWMAAFAFFSLNAFLLGLAERVVRAQSAWFCLSALFAGAAVACKPVALSHAAALLIVFGLMAVKDPALRRSRLLLAAAAFFLLPLLPWFVQGALAKGQPFYPFPVSLFGLSLGSGASPAYFQHVQGFRAAGALDWLRLPYDVFFQPSRLGADGHLGFLLLALAPAALAWRLSREMRWTSVYVLLGVLFWSAGPHVLRYGLFLVPAAGLLAAHGAIEAEAWARSKTWSLLWRGLLLLGMALASLQTLAVAVKDFDPFKVVMGREPVDRYLERQGVPQAQACAWMLDHGADEHSRVLVLGDARSAWLPSGATAASAFEALPLGAWVGEAASPEQVGAMLRRKGYDFVLFNGPEWERLRAQDPPGPLYWPAGDAAAKQRFFDWLDSLRGLPPGRRLMNAGLLVARLR